jgi:hypothetical protein
MAAGCDGRDAKPMKLTRLLSKIEAPTPAKQDP